MAGLQVKGGTQESVSHKYIGVMPVQLIAFNPTKAELENLYGKTIDKEPQYIFDRDGKRTVVFNPWFRSVEQYNGKHVFINALKIWASKDKVVFKQKVNDNGVEKEIEKCRVIDNYGECTSHTLEEFKSGKVSPKCRVTGVYRPAMRGEETMAMLIKAWMNVQPSTKWDKDNSRWIPEEPSKLEEATISYDWDLWMAGDFSDIKGLVAANKDRILKIVVGVEKGADNVYRQYVYDGMFLRGWEEEGSYLQNKIDYFLSGETSVLVNKETREYKKVPRKEIYQLDTNLARIWEMPVANFNQGAGGMPSMQQTTANAAASEKKDDWDSFVAGNGKAATADQLPGMPAIDGNPDMFGVEPGNPDDLPF